MDARLTELGQERSRVEAELESLEHRSLSEADAAELVRQTARFTGSLEALLRQGPRPQRQAAVRRCVEHFVVDRDKQRLKLTLRVLPTVANGSLAGSNETVFVHY